MSLVVRVVVGAVFFGAVHALLRGELWSGVVTGVIYGVGIALVGRFTQRSAMARLTFQERRLVRRKLSEGAGVSDSRLAAALVERAKMLLAVPVPAKVAGIGAALFATAGAAVLVVGYATRGVFVGVLLVAFAAVLVVPAWWAGGRRRELIARSLAATERETGAR